MPGLYSMLSALTVNLFPMESQREGWVLSNYDRRFKRLKLTFGSKNISGNVVAFHFSGQNKQSTIADLENGLVENNEFKGIRALIIGGSRGLGNKVAKILCAGGGAVTITYSNGKLEANAFQRELLLEGKVCEAEKFTVGEDCFNSILKEQYNQIYYFASPKIFDRKLTGFDVTQYQKFRNFYLRYFSDLCHAAATNGLDCRIFYPSSVAVGERTTGMEEYAKAKREGEKFCEKFSLDGGIQISYPRLPRLDTDQTQSIVPIKNVDAVSCLLKYIREMCSSPVSR